MSSPLKRFLYKGYWVETFLENDNEVIKHFASIEAKNWVVSTRLFINRHDAVQEAKAMIDEIGCQPVTDTHWINDY